MPIVRLLLAVIAISAVSLVNAHAQEPAEQPGRLEFQVLREGKPFGTHEVFVTRDGEALKVRDVASYLVKIGPIVPFRYNRTCEETWRDGALEGFDCVTRKDGRTIQVTGVRTPQGLTVTGPRGAKTYANALPFSPWSLAPYGGATVIDTETGLPMKGGIEDRGAQTAIVQGQSLRVQRYRVEGSIGGEFWYDPIGRWVRLNFRARGNDIEYVLRSPLDEAPF